MLRTVRMVSLAWVLGALLLALAGPLFAQSPFFLPSSSVADQEAPRPPDQEAPAREAAPPEPGPYPLPLLSRAIEETDASLREVEKRIGAGELLAQIGTGLDETARTLEGLESLLGSAELRAQSLRSLVDRRQSWRRLNARVQSLEKTLEDRAKALDRDRATVRRLEERWAATREALDEREVPAVVSRRVESVLSRLLSLQDPVRKAFAEVLLFQERAASQRIRITGALEVLDAAVAAAQERMFARRGRPLWRLAVELREGPGLREELIQTVRDKAGAIREYFSETPGALPSLFLFLAVLLAASFWVRTRAAAFEGDANSRRLLETRPISSAVLVGVLVWSYGQFSAPRPVIELAVLVLAAPLYRVLSLWLPDSLRPSLGRLVGLVLLDRLRGLVSDESWAGRLGVFALAVGGAVLIVWTLRRQGPWRDPRARSRWVRFFVVVAQVVAASLLVSAVSNAVGQAGLAEILLRGSLASLFLGAVLTAASLVVETWLGLLTPIGERLAGTQMASETERLRSLLVSLTRIAAVAGWALSILTIFGIGNALVAAAWRFLIAPWHIGTVSVSLTNLLGFGLALAAGLTVARLLRLLLDHTLQNKLALPRGVPAAISTTAQYIMTTLGVILAIFALGIDASRFTILASAVAVGVGFGLQNVVNNFVSGLILLYERPIQTGDTVEMGTLLGTVGRIGVRSSTVRTFDGAEVIVPNATLISTEVTNWTLSDRLRRIEVPVGVSYGSDPRRVITILEEVVRSLDGVLSQPPPAVLFQAFGESSLDFAVRAWTANFEDWLRLRSDLHLAIFESLARNGIEIPFPQRDVHLKA